MSAAVSLMQWRQFDERALTLKLKAEKMREDLGTALGQEDGATDLAGMVADSAVVLSAHVHRRRDQARSRP